MRDSLLRNIIGRRDDAEHLQAFSSSCCFAQHPVTLKRDAEDRGVSYKRAKADKKVTVPFGVFAGANSTTEQWKALPLDISLAAHQLYCAIFAR